MNNAPERENEILELPVATIVHDAELVLPYAEPAKIADDFLIVDAKVCYTSFIIFVSPTYHTFYHNIC